MEHKNPLLYKQLKDARLKASLSQRKVEEQLNIPQSTLTRYETNKSPPPTIALLYRLSELYQYNFVIDARAIQRTKE